MIVTQSKCLRGPPLLLGGAGAGREMAMPYFTRMIFVDSSRPPGSLFSPFTPTSIPLLLSLQPPNAANSGRLYSLN